MHNTFSSKSDVWSFGVCQWEIYSFGRTPYHKIPNSELLDELQNDVRLESPPDCPPEIYQVMQMCW